MASALALAARLGYSSVLNTRSDPLIMPRGGNAAAVADGAGSVGGCHAPCVAHVEAEVIAAAAEACCCCSSGLVQVVVLPVLAGTSCVVGSLPACSCIDVMNSGDQMEKVTGWLISKLEIRVGLHGQQKALGPPF